MARACPSTPKVTTTKRADRVRMWDTASYAWITRAPRVASVEVEIQRRCHSKSKVAGSKARFGWI